MKVLSRIDGSVCGAILSTRPSATRAAVSARPQLRDDRPSRAPASQCRRDYTRDARTHCSHCPQTASWLLSTFLPAPAPSRRPRPPNYSTLPCGQRNQRYSHATAAAAAVNSRPDHVVVQRKEHLLGFVERPAVKYSPSPRNEELLDFVEHEDVGTVQEHLDLIEDPYLNRYARPEPTRLLVSDRKEETEYPSFHEAVRGDDDLAMLLNKIGSTVGQRTKYPTITSLDSIYDMYSSLPEPRMMRVPARLRHRLLTAFGTPRKKNSKTMLRYFSLVGDVKDSGMVLRRNEWNYALALASRYVGRTTETELASALQLFKEMETQAETKGNEVTFNILFDAASKSGNFELAEMIYNEMESRRIPYNRYHHVSLIHFFGLKHDADGIRAAYKETVEAGELVDTAVLNSLISSFLRCGDVDGALRVYEHMKATHSDITSAPKRNYYTNIAVTRVLRMFTKIGKKHPALRPQLQALVDTTPDLRTYRALINYFAIKMGNLKRVAQLLDEMKLFNVPIHGGIFLMLFKGFHTHGQFDPEWSPLRLKKVFESLLTALDQENEGFYLDTWLMMWALRAFQKCTTKDTVLDVYDEFRTRWKLEPDRVDFMNWFLSSLLSGKDDAKVGPKRTLTLRKYKL